MSTNVINIKHAPRGWEDDPSFVYIGRAGKGHDGYFGNPITMNDAHGDRVMVLQAYTAYLYEALTEPEFRRRVRNLADKTLVCFCKPLQCHGDMLARAADYYKENE